MSCEEGSQWVGLSEVVRQASPGPVSLEIFGLEEKEDEPLELPLQAAITVLPTPDPGMHFAAVMPCTILEQTGCTAGFLAVADHMNENAALRMSAYTVVKY